MNLITHSAPSAAPDTPLHHEMPPVSNRSGPAARALTTLTAGLALIASVAGLLIPNLYTGAASTVEMLRGFDLVTAVIVVPGLMAAERIARRGSVRAALLRTGLIAYLVYTYAYYLFGTGFNRLFLLHAAVVSASIGALILTLVDLDRLSIAERFDRRGAPRAVAGILAVLAAALGGMWLYFAVDNAVTGDVPPGSQLVETETIIHLGMALDLTVLVPLYAVAAVLLWRQARWGFVLAAIALFAGVLHQLSYMVALVFQSVAHLPGAVSYDAVEPIIVLLYLIGAMLLLRGAAPTARSR